MNLEKIAKFAKEAHAGQKRKTGEDYFNGHVREVAILVEDYFSNINSVVNRTVDSQCLKSETIAVALLHDVVEDTDANILTLNLPENVIKAVHLLTRVEEQNYFDFIFDIISEDSIAGAMARIVKYADLSHNLSTLQEGSLKDKYRFALHLLIH